MNQPTPRRTLHLATASLSFLLASCGDLRAPTTTPAAPELASTRPTQSCYRLVTGRDTVFAALTVLGTTVTGELHVLPAEKDRARGSFRGSLRGDQLVVDWQRAGEGTTQVQELTFTLAGDSLRWREGERTERGGKWVLTNVARSHEYVLGRVACPARR